MKALFDYINNNTLLATIIGIVVGWLLSFVSTMYFHKKEKHEKQQELKRKENKNSLKINLSYIFAKKMNNKMQILKYS